MIPYLNQLEMEGQLDVLPSHGGMVAVGAPAASPRQSPASRPSPHHLHRDRLASLSAPAASPHFRTLLVVAVSSHRFPHTPAKAPPSAVARVGVWTL